jgi:hypothetical protein
MTTQDGEVLGVTKVVDHGDPAARFDLVVVSEGYTRADLDNGVFANDVDDLVQALLRQRRSTSRRCSRRSTSGG